MGDLFIRNSFHFAKHKHLPILRRKRFQAAADGGTVGVLQLKRFRREAAVAD